MRVRTLSVPCWKNDERIVEECIYKFYDIHSCFANEEEGKKTVGILSCRYRTITFALRFFFFTSVLLFFLTNRANFDISAILLVRSVTLFLNVSKQTFYISLTDAVSSSSIFYRLSRNYYLSMFRYWPHSTSKR